MLGGMLLSKMKRSPDMFANAISAVGSHLVSLRTALERAMSPLKARQPR